MTVKLHHDATVVYYKQINSKNSISGMIIGVTREYTVIRWCAQNMYFVAPSGIGRTGRATAQAVVLCISRLPQRHCGREPLV